MRVRVAASFLTTGLLMAGCAQKPLPAPVAAAAPDPFGYEQRSAVCTVSPIKSGPAGESVSVATRSDDGLCAIPITQPGGGAYASFLLQTLPAHGKAFIHNYNNQTLIDYTATTAYAGPDSFTVSLVSTSGGPRTLIRIDAMVDATGVVRPVIPLTSSMAPQATGTHKTTHHTTTRTKKKKTTGG